MPCPNPLTGYDLGFVVGMFEGEGAIALNRTCRPGRDRPYFTVHLSVTNTCLDLLRAFEKAVGIGKISSKPVGERRRPCWVWRCWRQADSLWLLEQMQPRLLAKAEKAELVMPFLRSRLALGARFRANCQRVYSADDVQIWERYIRLDSYVAAGNNWGAKQGRGENAAVD